MSPLFSKKEVILWRDIEGAIIETAHVDDVEDVVIGKLAKKDLRVL